MPQDTHEQMIHRGRSHDTDRALSVSTPAGWAFEQLVLASLDRRSRLDVRTERAHPAEAPAASCASGNSVATIARSPASRNASTPSRRSSPSHPHENRRTNTAWGPYRCSPADSWA